MASMAAQVRAGAWMRAADAPEACPTIARGSATEDEEALLPAAQRLPTHTRFWLYARENGTHLL